MHFGVCFFPTAYAISPLELGPALEERGFKSVWLAGTSAALLIAIIVSAVVTATSSGEPAGDH